MPKSKARLGSFPAFFFQPLSPALTGRADSGVTQTPRHLIKARGQQVTLRCSPVSGHLSVSWYLQALNQGPQFLFEFYDQMPRAKGNVSDRFSVQQPSNSLSELTVKFSELTDSSLYLCASSLAQPCWVTSLLCTNLPAPVRSNFRADRSVRAQKLQWERPPGPRAPMPFRQG